MSPSAMRYRRRVRLRGAAIAFLAAVAQAGPLPAQQPDAVITGRVLAAADARPLPFSLVTLGGAAASGFALTDRDGHFRFRQVPAGEYRLRLERVGFEPDTGVRVRIAAGDRLDVVVEDVLRPLALAPTDTAGGVCYPGSLLDRSPTLNALWREARKAARARRALDLSYRYRVQLTERLAVYSGWPLRGRGYELDSARRGGHKLTSTPEVARTLAARGAFAGYGVGMDSTRLVAVSEMLEVLDDGYLGTNCLIALPDRNGERRIRFEPLNPDPSRTDLIGNLVLDRTLTLRRIEFEYRHLGLAVARGVVEYGDGGLPGGQLRFVHSMRVEMLSAPQTVGEVIELRPAAGWQQRATVTASYGDFVSAGGR